MYLYRENEIMLTRRAFIRAAGLTFTGLAVPTGLAAQNRNSPKNKPNVLIVLTDDQGYGDLSCHGNDYWDDTYRHNHRIEEYKGYCTDAWFDEAMDYMKVRHANNEPFFVYLPTNCPHSPHWVINKHKKWLPKNKR